MRAKQQSNYLINLYTGANWTDNYLSIYQVFSHPERRRHVNCAVNWIIQQNSACCHSTTNSNHSWHPESCSRQERAVLIKQTPIFHHGQSSFTMDNPFATITTMGGCSHQITGFCTFAWQARETILNINVIRPRHQRIGSMINDLKPDHLL